MATKIRFKRGDSSNNTTIHDMGEPVYETNTGLLRMGNGAAGGGQLVSEAIRVKTLSDMKAIKIKPTDNVSIFVYGRNSHMDGFEGEFIYSPDSSLPDDNATVISPNSIPGRFIRVGTYLTDKIYKAVWFEFASNGSDDDTVFFKTMNDSLPSGATVYFDDKTYVLSESNGGDENGVVVTKRISYVGSGKTVFKSTTDVSDLLLVPYSLKFTHSDTLSTDRCFCRGIIFESCRIEISGTRNFTLCDYEARKARTAVRFHNNKGLCHSGAFVYDMKANHYGGNSGDTFLYTQNIDFDIRDNVIDHLSSDINDDLTSDKGKGHNIYGGQNFNGIITRNRVYANANTTGGIQVYSETLDTSKYSNITISDNICINGENPFYNYRSYGVTITNNTAISPRLGHGVYVYQAAGTVVTNNRIDKKDEFDDNIGVYISESPDCIVNGNQFTDVKNAISFANTVGGICVGNTAKRVNNGSYMNNGVLLLGCDGINVSDNDFKNYTNAILVADSAVGHTIDNNIFDACTYGVNINKNISSALKDISITNNKFYGAFSIGVNVNTSNTQGNASFFIEISDNDYSGATFAVRPVTVSGGAENYYWKIESEKYPSITSGITVSIDKYYSGTISGCLFTSGAGSAVGFAIGDIVTTHVTGCDFHEMAKAIDINGGNKNVVSENFFRACGTGVEISANNSKAINNYNIDTTTTVSNLGTDNTIVPNY